MKILILVAISLFVTCATAEYYYYPVRAASAKVQRVVPAPTPRVVPTPAPTQPATGPSPYIFSYAAGISPGLVDRVHTEFSDGAGSVRGFYSYIDPDFEVRTVQYIADSTGFHPLLSHEVTDTDANRQATSRHFALFDKIAKSHANIRGVTSVNQPADTLAVSHAKKKHLIQFKKIAQEHARLGAERNSRNHV